MMKGLLLLGLLLTNFALAKTESRTEITCEAPGSRAQLSISISSENLLQSGNDVEIIAHGMMVTSFQLTSEIQAVSANEIVLKLTEKRPDFLAEGDEFQPLILEYKLRVSSCSNELKIEEGGVLNVVQRNNNRYLLDQYNLTRCEGSL